jgi:hypothetical protein
VEEGRLTEARAAILRNNRETQRRCWNLFQTIRKGNNNTGGLTHVLVPKPNSNPVKYTRVQHKHELDYTLLQRNINHFQQAHGTPFTDPVWNNILQLESDQSQIPQILEGIFPSNIPKYPKLFLQQMGRVCNTIPLDMSLDDMCDGLLKWREQTTTSPSGKHLGIYRALAKARKHQIYTNNDTKQDLSYNDSNNQPIATKCLHIPHLLMTLSILKSHTFERWQIVHNFLLEKIPGYPLIDKLRVIHIYEADWSLINKFYIAKQLNTLSTIEQTVPIEQAGGRPNRSAIELAASQVILYESIRLQKLQASVLYNDAKACYDRIIENISNLSLIREGLPIELAKLHAQTFDTIQYHIKHRYGIGTTHHSHNNPSPIYGVGQGSTDAPARWGYVCDALLNIYKALGRNANLHSPTSTKTTNHKVAGFVGDTTLLNIRQAIAAFLVLQLQLDAQLWEKLLHMKARNLEMQIQHIRLEI